MDYMIYISEFGGDDYIIDQRFPKFKMAQAELRWTRLWEREYPK